MSFNDRQELRRVAQVLRECSAEQVVSLLREASIGLNKLGKNVYRLDLREPDDDDDADYDAEDDAWT